MNEHSSAHNPFLGLLVPLAAAPAKPPRKPRREPLTGKFATRQELVEAVWRDHENTDRNLVEMGKAYGVGPYVVSTILKGERPLTLGPRPERGAVRLSGPVFSMMGSGRVGAAG